MLKTHPNSEISPSTIPSGHMISSLLTKKATLCKFDQYARADSDKYADQQQVFEKVGL